MGSSNNQFYVHLPTELATAVREDVAAGKYVIKDVLKQALTDAHEAANRSEPDPADPVDSPGSPEFGGYVDGPARSLDFHELSIGEADPSLPYDSEIVVVPHYVPAVGEPVPQRSRWFSTIEDLDAWLLTAADTGERVESVSYDSTGGSILAIITDVAVVR